MTKTISFMGDTGTFCNNYIIAVQKLKADSVILLGDNFYPVGINNDHLRKFNNLWSNKYINKYMILGNHEYSGIPVQLYLKKPYWIMPDYCYMIEYEHCDIVCIDTMQLEPNWGLPDYHIAQYINGPGVVTKNLVVKSTGAKDFNHIFYYQLKNIVKCLNKNKNKPKIVCGHYHLETPGCYSTNKKLKEILMPLFKKSNVKAYVCGHEHLSEHRTIKEDNYELHHFIAGGLETRHILNPSKKTHFSTIESAYLTCSIYKSKWVFKFLSPDRTVHYSFDLKLS